MMRVLIELAAVLAIAIAIVVAARVRRVCAGRLKQADGVSFDDAAAQACALTGGELQARRLARSISRHPAGKDRP